MDLSKDLQKQGASLSHAGGPSSSTQNGAINPLAYGGLKECRFEFWECEKEERRLEAATTTTDSWAVIFPKGNHGVAHWLIGIITPIIQR